jgi:thymidylate synthase
VDPLIRDHRLDLAVMFRSHDFGRPGFGKSGAYVENLYGLSVLQKHMCRKLIRCRSCQHIMPGSITTFSVSAHYYQ